MDGDGYDIECDDDCNDLTTSCGADCYPGNPEVCDGYDNDCNQLIDDGVCSGGTLTVMSATYPNIIGYQSCAPDSSTNAIYCLGGEDTISTNEPETDQILKYDTLGDSITSESSTLPLNTSLLSCAEDGATNKIYCFGGYWQEFQCTQYNGSDCVGGTAIPHYLDTIVEFDPSSGSVNTMTETLPEVRKALSCVYANNRIYCLGGMNYNEAPTDEITEYNPATDTLVTKSATLPIPTSYLSCADANNNIYCFAGFSSSGSLNTTFEYDPVTDAVTPMSSVFPVHINRISCAPDHSDESIYCFGGFTTDQDMYNTSYLSHIYRYDPIADTLEFTGANFSQGRHSLSCAESGSGIYCFGGARSVIALDEITRFTP